MDAGANPDAKDEDGFSALHYAATHGRLECVRLLVDRGADVNYIQEET
jgi:ankyrin repeat protein